MAARNGLSVAPQDTLQLHGYFFSNRKNSKSRVNQHLSRFLALPLVSVRLPGRGPFPTDPGNRTTNPNPIGDNFKR